MTTKKNFYNRIKVSYLSVSNKVQYRDLSGKLYKLNERQLSKNKGSVTNMEFNVYETWNSIIVLMKLAGGG